MGIIRLIDTSGGVPASVLDKLRKEFRIGDRIIMFDTEPHGDKVMRSQHDIDTYQWQGGGGTMLNSTLELIERTDPDATIYCYTDGYFYDGDSYESTVIKNSTPFKNQRFKIVLFSYEELKHGA